MDIKEIENRFFCGKVEAVFYNSKTFMRRMKALYLVAGIYFLWMVMQSVYWDHRVEYLLGVLFCLWRLVRQDEVMCVVAEKGIVVRQRYVTWKSFWEEQLSPSKRLIFLAYNQKFFLSADGKAIHMGNPATGNVVTIPVALQFLNKKDRQLLKQHINRRQENQDIS
ncbi:hypothetical protein [uncultured Megasphaera sp.]|uniref:hypothetical protein n=1 Tax=uncultured Megasphaera sp. TaxID=165188 RepID=UPI002593BEA7|nr:hypothetical protein [uncultured Megasphaera sp.]